MLRTALELRAAGNAPQIEAARVRDLEYTLEPGKPALFSWTYLNPGDYDLNGEVTLADLVSIATFYQKSQGDGDWPAASVADGDRNGEVNASDVTPIAMNFGAVVSGYALQHSGDAGGTNWQVASVLPRTDWIVPAEGGVPRFEASVEHAQFGHYYRAVPFHQTESGQHLASPGVPVLFVEDARGDWSMTGRDAQHTSLSSFTGPSTNHLLWQHEIGGNGLSGPVYNIAGTIYVGGEDGLYIINSDHFGYWVFPTPELVETTPALGSDGAVYFGCNDGVFRALTPGGALKWSIDTGGPIHGDPVVAENGAVYFGSDDMLLYAADPAGNVLWTWQGTTEIRSPVTLSPDNQLVIVHNNDRLTFLTADGNPAEIYPDGLYSRCAPMITDYPLRVPAEYPEPEPARMEALFAVGDQTLRAWPMLGTESDWTLDQWTDPDRSLSSMTPSAAPGDVVYCSVWGTVMKCNADGSTEYLSEVSSYGNAMDSAVVDRDGCVYFALWSGAVVRIDPVTLVPTYFPFEYRSGDAVQIALADDTLLVTTSAGWLYGFGGEFNGMVPDPPQNLDADDGERWDRIALDWDPVNGAEGYEVFREDVLIQTLYETYYTDEGLEPGTQYEFKVRAYNSAGPGLFSEPDPGHTRLFSTSPLTASMGEFSDRIVLNWNDVENETGYSIYRDGTSPAREIALVSANQTSWTDTSLTDWDTHTYYVQAVNDFTVGYRAEADGSLVRGSGDTGADSWNQYGGNAMHQRRSSAIGPADASDTWQRRLEYHVHYSTCFSPMFGSEGAIYLPRENTIVCLDGQGRLRWLAAGSGQYSALLPDGGIAAWSGWAAAELRIYNSNGTERASSAVFETQALTLLEDGTLIAAGPQAVFSLNQDLTFNWIADGIPGPKGPAAAVSPEGNIYVVTKTHTQTSQGGPGGGDYPVPLDLTALDSGGSELWHFNSPDGMSVPVVMDNGNVVVANDEYLLSALEPDGGIAWEIQLLHRVEGLAVDHLDRLLCTLGNGEIVCYGNDGSELWREDYSEFASYGFVEAPAVDGNNHSYHIARAEDGITLLALDESGTLRWPWQPDATGLSGVSISDSGQLVFCGRNELYDENDTVVFAVNP